MTKTRVYGQYCGFARALEMVGERWALLVIRDLLTGPKRYTDLRQGLPKIPTNILAARLRELEQDGLVQRRVLPRPSAAVVYELTDFGRELEDAVLAIGRWGARALGELRPGEVVSVDSMLMALRTTFQPDAAWGLTATYELRMGEIVLHARIVHGVLETGSGPLPGADLVIEAGPAIRALMAGELTAAEAVASGGVRLTGDASLLERFAGVFRIGPAPPARVG